MNFLSFLDPRSRCMTTLTVTTLLCCLPLTTHAKEGPYFDRIATFPTFRNTSVNSESVAEIVDASRDGKTLIYTDGPAGKVGFVDIQNPANPKPLGAIDVGGTPTSVAVISRYALVGVTISPSFTAPSGVLQVVDLNTRAIVATQPLAGQPDSVAVSPDRRFAAVVIENERDEEFGNGEPPQLPSGLLQVVDLVGGLVRDSRSTPRMIAPFTRFTTAISSKAESM